MRNGLFVKWLNHILNKWNSCEEKIQFPGLSDCQAETLRTCRCSLGPLHSIHLTFGFVWFLLLFYSVCKHPVFLTRLDVPVISLTKNESSQVLLDCSLGSEGIRVKKFDWKVNGTQEVFLYDGGDVYTEDPQFKGRVQHKSLDSNNASITISNALVKDTGIYECIYIDETNQKTTKSRISLTVGECLHQTHTHTQHCCYF